MLSNAPVEEMEWEDEVQYLSKTEHDFRKEQYHVVPLKIDEYGYTDLHNAISDNDPQMVKRLIEYESLAAEWQTCEGETPLYLACAKRDVHIGIVEILLHKFPQACHISNKDEMYPLQIATFNRRLDIVKLLIEHNAPVNATGSYSFKNDIYSKIIISMFL
jgi:ankyrin repeat protein